MPRKQRFMPKKDRLRLADGTVPCIPVPRSTPLVTLTNVVVHPASPLGSVQLTAPSGPPTQPRLRGHEAVIDD